MAFMWIIPLSVMIQGIAAPCTVSVMYTWPLGRGIGTRELNSTVATGTIGGGTHFGEGPPSLGPYDAFNFNGANDSYVDIRVENTDLWPDYSLDLYVYPSSLDGVFMHYASDTHGASSNLTNLKFELQNGEVVLTLYAQNVITIAILSDFKLELDQWHHLVFGRDGSGSNINVVINTSTVFKNSFEVINGINTDFPGSLRLGKSQDGSGVNFSGRVTCLQLIPCKDAHKTPTFVDECIAANWAATLTTSTTSSTTSSSPSSTTSTTRSSTTSTTPISTTSTTPSSKTSTTPSRKTSSTITLYDSQFKSELIIGCTRYTIAGYNVTYNLPSDIIATFTVPDVKKCFDFCQRFPACLSFVLKQGLSTNTCLIGKKSPATTKDVGSVLYNEV